MKDAFHFDGGRPVRPWDLTGTKKRLQPKKQVRDFRCNTCFFSKVIIPNN